VFGLGKHLVIEGLRHREVVSGEASWNVMPAPLWTGTTHHAFLFHDIKPRDHMELSEIKVLVLAPLVQEEANSSFAVVDPSPAFL
jgi:hypothetical protein